MLSDGRRVVERMSHSRHGLCRWAVDYFVEYRERYFAHRLRGSQKRFVRARGLRKRGNGISPLWGLRASREVILDTCFNFWFDVTVAISRLGLREAENELEHTR
jgi:hypothetical protein